MSALVPRFASRLGGVLALTTLLAAGVVAQRGASETNRHDLLHRQFDARVARVADGDTLDVLVAGESRPIRVRLEGVDAPEQGETFDREAVAFVRKLVLNQRVRISGREIDRYGRLIVRVLADGRDASAALVRAGLACHAYAYDALLAREESDARAAGAGFWGPNQPKPACVTRTAFSGRGRTSAPTPRSSAPSDRGTSPSPSVPPPSQAARPPRSTHAGPFHGNVTSAVYHAPSCRNYNCRNCTRSFSTEAEARAAGFRPAADCLEH